jgi:alcohol dehydrogenase class IV
MLRNWEFQLPARVQFGRGGLRKLGAATGQFGSSALLVGYCDCAPLAATWAKAIKSLTDAGVKVTEFLAVVGEPDPPLAAEGARLAREAGCNVMVALGGGSVIDAAKGIAVLATIGGDLWDYTDAAKEPRPVAAALPVIAVPTTAGTGAEVTSVAVFACDVRRTEPHSVQVPDETNRRKEGRSETPSYDEGRSGTPSYMVKASLVSPAIFPKVAIVDPELAVGSPARLTAAWGADALGHAIEACMSRAANPISTALAVRAVGLIVANLPRAVANPDDPEPREPLALAATLAGAAFNAAGVTAAHAIAHALGAILHVPHAEAVAIATPLMLCYNAEACAEVYAELAVVCGLRAASPEELAACFVEQIGELLRSVGLPERIAVPADAPPDLPAALARNAVAHSPLPLRLNPRKLDEAALRELMGEICAQ